MIKTYIDGVLQGSANSTSHEDLTDTLQAKTGVTNGHISDGTQTIAGQKTFSDNTYFENIYVNGNIVQQGTAYETHAEKLYTTKNEIITRDGATVGLSAGEYTGLRAKLYDGINDGQLIFDKNGIARVGDEGDTQVIATREDTPVNGKVPIWNSTTFRFETANSPTTLSGYGITDATPSSHIGSTGLSHGVVTTSVNGFMSSTDKTKLDGIEAGANKYVHPTGDGNSHIPATGTTNNGKVLKAGATANSASWGNVDWSEIANKPTTFTPTAHNHAISEVTNLQSSLDAKVSTSDVVTTATANKILKLDASAKLPASITGNADGNASTATKLQTARKINGVSFDGSANITIPKIHTRGQIPCETGANRPAITGASTQSCYANGYPINYGEVLTLDGAGSAQLLLGWADSNGTAPAYIRSKRDLASSLWSNWHMIYTTAYKPSLADLGASPSSHTHEFSKLTLKPTTLAGYGITDGVTLSGTETLTNKTLTSPIINTGVTGSAVSTTGGANKLLKTDSTGRLNLTTNEIRVKPTTNSSLEAGTWYNVCESSAVDDTIMVNLACYISPGNNHSALIAVSKTGGLYRSATTLVSSSSGLVPTYTFRINAGYLQISFNATNLPSNFNTHTIARFS